MKWIKTSEQLPESYKEVLVLKYHHDKSDYVYNISYLEDVYRIKGSDKVYSFWRTCNGIVNSDYYQYWMPLPEIPTEKTKKKIIDYDKFLGSVNGIQKFTKIYPQKKGDRHRIGKVECIHCGYKKKVQMSAFFHSPNTHCNNCMSKCISQNANE